MLRIKKKKMLKILDQTNIKEFEKGPIRRSLFSNGAVSLFHHAKGFSGGKINLTFLAGSLYENQNQHGIAHLIEHLLFKEAKNQNIIKELELAGAQINAYTYKECVTFELDCNGSKIKDFLPKFLQLFLVLDFTEEEFLKEKEVIIQELLEDEDDHEGFILEKAFAYNFTDNVGHPVGGTSSKVKNYTMDQVFEYYKKHFVPKKMILTIVSGEKYNQLESDFLECMNLYSDIKSSKPQRIKPLKKYSKLNHVNKKFRRDTKNAILLVSFDGPAMNHPLFYDISLLDEYLFEGLSSVYFQKLREEKPLVYSLGSSVNVFSDQGSYLLIFNTSQAKMKETKKEVFSVLKSLEKEEIKECELEAIKSRILDNWEISFDDLSERADFITDHEVYQLREYSIDVIRRKITDITPKTIKNLVKRILQSNYTVLEVLPKTKGKK